MVKKRAATVKPITAKPAQPVRKIAMNRPASKPAVLKPANKPTGRAVATTPGFKPATRANKKLY